MKVLMVNKFYYIKGGSERYYFSLKKLLEDAGHTVIDFSMQSEHNFPSEYSNYFVNNVDYEHIYGLKEKVRAASNIIYSFEAKKKFEQIILKEKPDIIHLHIFQHQISPSILDVIKKYQIPTVYTAHDLKMLCLNYKMMHHGKICEECKGGHYFMCAKNKCVKDSLSKSLINTVEGYLHKWRKSYNAIDYIITPSLFYKEKFEQFGISPERVVHITNFLDTKDILINKRKDTESYYLYFGRLSEEKGILTLVKSFASTKRLLYIVGDSPYRKQFEKYILEKGWKNIQIFGFLSGQDLIDVVGNAKAVVIPSEWYENGPYAAIEALQLGRPIIGANIGGIPELVKGNGFLFESGNSSSLTEAVMKLEWLDEIAYQKLVYESYRLFKEEYTEQSHLTKLMDVYSKALEKHNEKGLSL